MSAPLPATLRARFQRYVEEGLSGRAAALRLKVSPATGAPWRHQIQTTGQVDPAQQGRPKSSDHCMLVSEVLAHGHSHQCSTRSPTSTKSTQHRSVQTTFKQLVMDQVNLETF